MFLYGTLSCVEYLGMTRRLENHGHQYCVDIGTPNSAHLLEAKFAIETRCRLCVRCIKIDGQPLLHSVPSHDTH